MDGDPTQNIRMIRPFLPSSATVKFVEQQPVDFDTMDGRFAGLYLFLGVTYPDLTASPISNINFIKYIILRFVLTTFRRKNEPLSRFHPAGAATRRCKVVQLSTLKHF